jgi:hypothetical protein
MNKYGFVIGFLIGHWFAALFITGIYYRNPAVSWVLTGICLLIIVIMLIVSKIKKIKG